MTAAVPEIRIRKQNARPPRPDADFVLYWMIAFRRPRFNFALQRAVEWCLHLGKPLVVLEALRCDYQWASDRLHRFVWDGMLAQQAYFAKSPVYYYCYVEPEVAAGKGLLQELASRAAVVVTDDFPAFFIPRMVAAAGHTVPVLMEAVDSNGLLPLRATDQVFTVAHSFRRYLQKTLPPHLDQIPAAEPALHPDLIPAKPVADTILQRWPPATREYLNKNQSLAALPINHDVGVVEERPGGFEAATERWEDFLHHKLSSYPEERNHPDEDGGSGLSPYLHFGFLSVHQLFVELTQREEWEPDRLATKPNGKRSGWWGMREAAEAFLDELITWREVGYNMSWQVENYDQYESLPDWAKTTLADHAKDKRPYLYTLAELENAQTHDELWNAAQNQLLLEGRIHNYMRMLWGKKILEWTKSPQQALEILIELNNKYALDGRDPNSYSGIFWTLGRYDRAWGPERPIFGKVRYMSSDNTARKLKLESYVDRYKDI